MSSMGVNNVGCGLEILLVLVEVKAGLRDGVC